MGLTDNQKRVWDYVVGVLLNHEYPTLNEIKVAVRLSRIAADHATKALETAGLLERNLAKNRRLELTADGLKRARADGLVPRTAEKELAQVCEYIEHKLGQPCLAEDLRIGDHWTPESLAEIAEEKVAQQADRALDVG